MTLPDASIRGAGATDTPVVRATTWPLDVTTRALPWASNAGGRATALPSPVTWEPREMPATFVELLKLAPVLLWPAVATVALPPPPPAPPDGLPLDTDSFRLWAAARWAWRLSCVGGGAAGLSLPTVFSGSVVL